MGAWDSQGTTGKPRGGWQAMCVNPCTKCTRKLLGTAESTVSADGVSSKISRVLQCGTFH